jgi:hypothetical protein
MRTLLLSLFFVVSLYSNGQETIKSKPLKLKYTLPQGWVAEEFGGKTSWEEVGNALCHCSGAVFTRQHKDGKMKVVIYPSTVSGLDSAKRSAVGNLRFEDVQKYEKGKTKNYSFERKKSNFVEMPGGKKSYEVMRYYIKAGDQFYIMYAWQESMNALNSTSEKDLYQMVNSIELMD